MPNYFWDNGDPTSIIQARDAVEALKKHKESLELLHLGLHTIISRTKTRLMPSMEHFTALQELFLTTDKLYDIQSLRSRLPVGESLTRVLPPNIVSLYLVKPR